HLREPVAITATPTDQSTSGFQRKVMALWAAVERACERDDFRPRPSGLCDYCAYKAYCPAWGGDPALAAALVAELAAAGEASKMALAAG
ncbi:MAG: recombinase RecB, partial [Actinobacteria bacterium]|nr:recombinase RecB [Actinomycetota bacterium]